MQIPGLKTIPFTMSSSSDWHETCAFQMCLITKRRDAIYIIRNILLPTDFSDCSAAAFEHASTFAVMYNARLHVLHVAKTPTSMTFDSDGFGLENVQTSHRSTHEDEVKRFVEKILPHQTKIIEVVRFGQPYKEIVDYALHEEIDLIVIATHGRTGLNHLMMGSVAEKVVRFSPVPVLTVKPSKLFYATASDGHLKQEIHEEKFNEYSR